MTTVAEWEAQGARIDIGEHRIFVIDRRAQREDGEPVLILHGFPTCSYDWRLVLPAHRRVVLFDMLGYGLSDKPLDHTYSLFEQADIAEGVARALGLDRLALVTHDMGDSVGGELCARSIEGTLGFDIARRVVTNGSIYMDLVQLSAGQQLILALPDEALPEENAPGYELFAASLAATFAVEPDEHELRAQWELLARAGGNRILPKLIRYVEERRVHERRWTGAIEKHPSPLTIVWGDADPIAVYPMAERLAQARADAALVRLRGIGHYLMLEAPEAVARALAAALP